MCVVFVVEKEEKGKKKTITGISGFGFFLVHKWPFRDAHLLFKKTLLKPLFYSVFWVCAFWAKLSKKGNF